MKKTALFLSLLMIAGNAFLLTGSSYAIDNNSNKKITYQIAHNGVDHTKGKSMMDSMMKSMGKMKKMKMSGHVDQDFGAIMMEHHMGAVDMAKMEVHSGMDTRIKKMAGEIITKQQKEIKELGSMVAKLQKANKTNKNHNMDFDKMLMDTMKMPMDKMMMQEHMDHNFVSMMKMHHEQGVDMANLEVKYGMDAGMKKMAQKIVDDQEKEIKIFQDWIDKHK